MLVHPRHLAARLPAVSASLRPALLGAVFPLGMYTACTFRLTEVMHAEFLIFIPRVFIYVALVAWALTFAGLMRQLTRRRRLPRRT